jgi:DMSO/TMAO reductase YedYZ molybdopterin-dependent catalytic subunit
MTDFIKPSQGLLLRRGFLRMAGLSGLGAIANGCALNPLGEFANHTFEPLNQKVESALFNPIKLAPEYPFNAIEPQALLINTYGNTPIFESDTFRLTIFGEVANPLVLSLPHLQKMPRTSMTIRHVCVEGWSAIVQWTGIRLSTLIQMVKPNSGVRYIYFLSADDYYESWDIASAMHPQTLLAYEKNGQPLEIENGAPLRLASPIKLGYKLSKWVVGIKLTSELLEAKGYWEDKGYEWFAGL